ncbi:MAG TPA: mersacidin/lichenicidin family type 2 lantibiotic [Herpetosiphonaceae bacterium]
MSRIDLVRVWKDEDYRLSLDAHQQAMLPKNPAGEIEVRDEDLEAQFILTLSTGSYGTGCTPHFPV